METYEFYPRKGLGPFRLGMTEEEAQAVQAGVPHPFRLEFLDGRLARIGLDKEPEYRVLYHGVDLIRTHVEELIPALAQEGEVECDCEDPDLLTPIASRRWAWSCGGKRCTTPNC